MKRKRLLCVVFALLLAASLTLPALGAEEGDLPEDESIGEEESAGEETGQEEGSAEEEEEPPEEEPSEKPEPPAEEEEETDREEELPGEEETPGEEELPEETEEGELPEETETPEEEALTEAAEPETLHVVVPSTSWVVVNPYGLEVTRDGISSREQIVSPVQSLTNLGNVPVRVDVWAVGEFPAVSEAYFVSEPPAPGAAGKELFLYAEFQPQGWDWDGWFGDLPNQLAITEWGEKKADVLELAPGESGDFRLFGGASVSPEEMWTEEDAVSVTLVFSFATAGEP